MRINDPKLIGALAALGVEHEARCFVGRTKLLWRLAVRPTFLLILRHHSLPELVRLLKQNGVPYRFLAAEATCCSPDGELPWVILQLERQNPEVRIEGNSVLVDCAADLGRTVTTCAKADLGGMEGLIGVPGTIGGALRMNAGAYGTQIGTFVREVQVYRGATGRIENLRGPK